MTELTSAQCDAFMENHHFVVCGCYGGNFFVLWEIYHSFTNEIKNNLSDFDTRQSAITAYWRKYHPDWQPPEIHDAEWALRYQYEHNLSWNGTSVFGKPLRWVMTPPSMQHSQDFIQTTKAWQAKYDPPKVSRKVSREEKAVELLREVYKLDYVHSSGRVADLGVRIENYFLEINQDEEG